MKKATILLLCAMTLCYAGCQDGKKLELCREENQTLSSKLSERDEQLKEQMVLMADALKQVGQKLQESRNKLKKASADIIALKENHKKARAKMEKALKSAMGRNSAIEKKFQAFVENYKAYENKVVALEKKLTKANKKLKDAESKAAKLTEENRNLKSEPGPQVKP